MTNGDRIRSMTDEELMLTQLIAACPEPYVMLHDDGLMELNCLKNRDCKTCWLNWLRQETKEPGGRSSSFVPWSFLEEYAAGKRHNFDSDFILEAKKAWEESK